MKPFTGLMATPFDDKGNSIPIIPAYFDKLVNDGGECDFCLRKQWKGT